jgi:hypothetical protein
LTAGLCGDKPLRDMRRNRANLRFGMCAGANWPCSLTLAAIEMEPGHEA